MAKLSAEELARRKEARAALAAERKAARLADPDWLEQRRIKSRIYCAAYKRRKAGIVLAPEEAVEETLRHEEALLSTRKAKAEALAASLERYEDPGFWAAREAELVAEATARRLRTLNAEVAKRIAAEQKRVSSKLNRLNAEIERIEGLESALAEKNSRLAKDAPTPAPRPDSPLGDADEDPQDS